MEGGDAAAEVFVVGLPAALFDGLNARVQAALFEEPIDTVKRRRAIVLAQQRERVRLALALCVEQAQALRREAHPLAGAHLLAR